MIKVYGYISEGSYPEDWVVGFDTLEELGFIVKEFGVPLPLFEVTSHCIGGAFCAVDESERLEEIKYAGVKYGVWLSSGSPESYISEEIGQRFLFGITIGHGERYLPAYPTVSEVRRKLSTYRN